MKTYISYFIFSCSLIVHSGLFANEAVDDSKKSNEVSGPAITPQPRLEEWWFTRHAENIGKMSKGEFDLLMLGDSITHNFESVGAEVWKKHFEPRKAINLGFGGDRTNHLLWRIQHLPVLKKSPKGAVVLIGRNNICWGSCLLYTSPSPLDRG